MADLLCAAYPLLFQPVLKQTIWGGRRLGDLLNKPIGTAADYAESWEVVDHGADQSVVADGPLQGQTLAAICRSHPRWLLGQDADCLDEGLKRFPLLLKYLDCNRVLSVQVHPDDAYGSTMTPPDLGKTEAWYVVEAQPDSLIYAGLQAGVDHATLAEAVEAGQTENVLHSFRPSPGDCVFIPAGTVHAIGAGLVIAEIQQASDTTFRLFDWNRVDSAGKARTLHIRQSLEVTDYARGPIHPVQSDPLRDGWQDLVRCDEFVLRSLHVGAANLPGRNQFHIVTVPRGTATLRTDSKESQLAIGQTMLIPAAMGDVEIEPAEDSVVLLMGRPS